VPFTRGTHTRDLSALLGGAVLDGELCLIVRYVLEFFSISISMGGSGVPVEDTNIEIHPP